MDNLKKVKALRESFEKQCPKITKASKKDEKSKHELFCNLITLAGAMELLLENQKLSERITALEQKLKGLE